MSNPNGLSDAQKRELADYFECLLDEHSVQQATDAVQVLWPLVLEDKDAFTSGPLIL